MWDTAKEGKVINSNVSTEIITYCAFYQNLAKGKVKISPTQNQYNSLWPDMEQGGLLGNTICLSVKRQGRYVYYI